MSQNDINLQVYATDSNKEQGQNLQLWKRVREGGKKYMCSDQETFFSSVLLIKCFQNIF